jgi:group I intron endonuclease
LTTGIYAIINKDSLKVYIGSSVEIEKRIQKHFWKLNKGIHHSSHLQRSYSKYGRQRFEVMILEETSKDLLVQRDQYWLEKYKSYICDYGYNNRKVAERNEGLKPWNKGKWKNPVSEELIIQSYVSGKTILQCQKALRTSTCYVEHVLHKNDVVRSKSDALLLMNSRRQR